MTHVAGAGRPVIFIPDLGAPADVWETTVRHLEGRVESHVLDIAGFAGHAPAAEPLLPALSEQLAAYVQERHLQRPIVVGHMFGATVAYALAMTHSDLLGGVLAIDAPPSRVTGSSEEEREAREGRRALADATPEQFKQMTARRLASLMKDQARATVLADRTSRSDQHVLAETLYATMTTDMRPGIPRIKAPVLVLLTTGNLPQGAVPEVEALYAKQLAPIPQHELLVVNASRHYVMFDAPEVFFANLDRFLGLRSPAAYGKEGEPGEQKG
jgi:pimeloyl-ACP methyl ester carboxylesterase